MNLFWEFRFWLFEFANSNSFRRTAITTPGIVLLASCNIYVAREDGPAKAVMFSPDPWLGIYRIKKWLEDRGLARVLLVDPNVDGNIQRKVKEFAEQRTVPIVGVSMTRQYIEYDLNNIITIRDWVGDTGQLAPVTLSGGYESTLGSDLVLSLGFVDGVVQGFGEFPLETLFRRYVSFSDPSSDKLRGCRLPGVVWKKGTEMREDLTPEAPPDPTALYRYEAQPLLHIPWLKYWTRKAQLRGEDSLDNSSEGVRLVTSSHCLATCGFCSSRRYGSFVLKALGLPPSVMMMPAEEVVDLVLDSYDKVGPEKAHLVYFVDDDFVIGGKRGMARFETFCRMMEELYDSGRLPRSFVLGMQTKTRHFATGKGFTVFSGGGKDSLRRIRKAGFKLLEFGAESFSDELLHSPFINKKISAEVNFRVIQDCMEAGIKASIFYIPFPPSVTPESFRESLSKLIELLEQGARLGMTPGVRIFSGSPASELVGDPAWPYRTKTVTAADGREVNLPEAFFPCDPKMNEAVNSALNLKFKHLKASLRRWQKPGVQLLADTARFLNYHDLYERLERLPSADSK